MFMFESNVPQIVLAVDRLRRHEAMKEAELNRLRELSRPTRPGLLERVLINGGRFLISVGKKLQKRRVSALPKSA